MTNHQPVFIHQSILNGDETHTYINESELKNVEEGRTLWQHIDIQDTNSVHWLENDSGFEPLITTALAAEETRPRSFKVDSGLVVILRALNTNPGHDNEDMVSIRLFISHNRIVSVQRRPIISVANIITDLDNGQGPCDSGDFLSILIDKMADNVGDFVNGIEEELDDTEEHLEVMEPSDLRAVLGSLRRQIAVVRRYMAPQRDALDRLNNIESDILSPRDHQLLREESDRVSRYLEDLDLARERAVVLQEAFLSQIAQEQNNRMYALSIISAIFLPLGFLTGLLGVNVGGIPGSNNQYAFWLFMFGLLLIIGLQYWLFKKLKWF